MSGRGSEDEYDKAYTGSMPALPDLGRVDLGKLAPMYGMPTQSDEPDYLQFDVKGRGYFERLFYNAGASYSIGFLAGTWPGVSEGLAKAPGANLRLKSNSLLNAISKHGIRRGNALGILALFYTSFESLSYNYYLDERTGMPVTTPLLAGLGTGLLYKSTAGLRVCGLAGIVGAGAASGFWFLNNFLKQSGFRM